MGNPIVVGLVVLDADNDNKVTMIDLQEQSALADEIVVALHSAMSTIRQHLELKRSREALMRPQPTKAERNPWIGSGM